MCGGGSALRVSGKNHSGCAPGAGFALKPVTWSLHRSISIGCNNRPNTFFQIRPDISDRGARPAPGAQPKWKLRSERRGTANRRTSGGKAVGCFGVLLCIIQTLLMLYCWSRDVVGHFLGAAFLSDIGRCSLAAGIFCGTRERRNPVAHRHRKALRIQTC